MNEITAYTKLIKARNIAKRLQQLSWSVSNIEKKYELDLLSPEEYAQMLKVYLDLIPELKNVLDELMKLNNEDKNGTL